MVGESCCLFRMVRSLFNFVISSLWWTLIVRCNFSWWLMTVYHAANWVKGIRDSAGVPNLATSELCTTVSSCSGNLIFKVEQEFSLMLHLLVLLQTSLGFVSCCVLKQLFSSIIADLCWIRRLVAALIEGSYRMFERSRRCCS